MSLLLRLDLLVCRRFWSYNRNICFVIKGFLSLTFLPRMYSLEDCRDSTFRQLINHFRSFEGSGCTQDVTESCRQARDICGFFGGVTEEFRLESWYFCVF